MEDGLIGIKELLRQENPKRRNRNKLFRSRYIWNGSGGIVKVVLLEQDPKNIGVLDPTRIYSVFDDDCTGLSANVIYSLKKKKRFLLPNAIKDDLPEFNDYDFPLPLKSVSINQIYRHRAQYGGPFDCFNFPYSNNFRAFNAQAKSLAVRRTDGSLENREGRFSSQKQFLQGEKDGEEGAVHFQYQVLHYKTIAGMQNSRKYECSCCRCKNYLRRSPQEMEPHRLGKDIPRAGHLFSSDDLSDHSDEDFCSHQEDYTRTFDLGEIPIRRERRRVKNGWVFVSDLM